MRETDYVDGTVDGNVIRYSWEENTSSGDEVDGPSYGDCEVKYTYCPTDFGLGVCDPELGNTGLEITWIGFVVSLSETVVAGILNLTVGAPTEAAFVAALQAVLISGLPLWVISAIAAAFVLTEMNYVAQNIMRTKWELKGLISKSHQVFHLSRGFSSVFREKISYNMFNRNGCNGY